ncbi:hypothetical protein GCK32_002547 [Trichostrongylus colubriformis]|uniref:Uncharacterized protein n=1 Tax=Trichostrongylus colubriformis TaxID=6319 RepID=A0AAN8J1X2_TRICO
MLLGEVFIQSLTTVNVLIIICYTLLMYFIRHTPMSEGSVKQISRSLIVTGLTTVFGWFTSLMIEFIKHAGGFEMAEMQTDLFAGLFVNFASAVNFFVYYACSNMYRREFDKYLLIGHFKSAIAQTIIGVQ